MTNMEPVSIGKIIKEVDRLLDTKELDKVKPLIKELHPSDIGIIIDHSEDEDKLSILSLLDDETAADALLTVDSESLDYIVNALGLKRISELTSEMEPDEAVDIIAELPEKTRDEIIHSMPKEEADKVSELLEFKETSAGGIMSTDFIGLVEDLTAEEALKKVREISLDPNVPQYIYVVDKDQRLVGILPFRNLVFAQPSKKLGKIVNRDVISVNLHDDQEEVADVVSKYDLLSVPVIDEGRRLRGVITVDDVVDVIRDEATEDIMRLSGTDIKETIFTSPRRSAMKRLPWLYLHLGTASITALIIGIYQETLSAFIALAVFMPLIASVGGSAGVQTLALIVRGIALGEVTFHDTRRLILKEIAVGLLTGLLIGVFVATFAYLWKDNPVFGLIIGASFIASQIFACGIGVFTPLTLRKLGVDPALASSPFLSSLIDCVSYFSLLGFATLFLRYLK